MADGAYQSPLVARIAEIRRGILHRAQAGNWIIDVAQLTDQAIIRRLVLKRCIYGVDKNRLTVELAKVSLWLHSFTVGAPLSFLDHHLRCGDSLIGIRVRDAIRELDRLGGLFAGSAMAGAEVAAEGMARIEEMSDADVVEVHESASVFRGVLPPPRRRRHQPLLAVRRARHESGQAGRTGGAAHAIRHLRRQDRRPLLQEPLHHRQNRRPVRLREPPSRHRPATVLPDVDSRFKFCALIFGGDERRFAQTRCAFFLHDTGGVDDPQRCFPLTPDDFARVNPNTGTAPVFRTRRDAEITPSHLRTTPGARRSLGSEERRVWPVRYHRMFDMTNDSALFRTAAELDADGFYRVAGNRWKKGAELCLPLYEGKMVQAFDHRAASIVVNPDNLNRPAQPRETTPEQHGDPSRCRTLSSGFDPTRSNGRRIYLGPSHSRT